MWNGKKSIRLSKFCVVVFAGMLLFTLVSAPWLVRWFLGYSRASLAGKEGFFLATIYIGSLPATVLLFCLYRLLHHIDNERVFTEENVEYLRKISWSCFAGAIIGIASTPYYFPWCIVAVAAAFMGLIVRVIKNIIAQAVELKNESELTI